MQCSKSFSIEIEEAGACCLLNSANTVVPGSPVSAIYATVDDRVFVVMDNTNVAVINATTNAVVGTILAPGSTPAMGCYSPINDRIYIINFTTAEIIEINPNTMAVVTTISPPAGVLNLQEPSYDTTNDLIYITGTTATDVVLVVFDPMTGAPNILVSEATPVVPEFLFFGRRAAHCSANNRIYVPRIYIDPIGNLFLMVRIFNTAGVFQSDITFPLATSSIGSEQCYWSVDTGFLYFLGDSVVADAPGAAVIDPTTNLVVANLVTNPENIGTLCFSSECQSVNILTSSGIFTQFDSITHASICATPVTAGTSFSIQMATSTAGVVFVPDFASTDVAVMSPP